MKNRHGFKELLKIARNNPEDVKYFGKGLLYLTSLGAIMLPFGWKIIESQSLEQKTKTEFVDTSEKNLDTARVSNLSFEDALFYKNLGIENPKQYTPKQLDSLVSEVYQNILW